MRLPTKAEERLRNIEQKAKAIGASAGALKLISKAKRFVDPDDKKYIGKIAHRISRV